MIKTILVLFNSQIISYLSSIESFINIWYVVALVVICLVTPISLVSGKVLDGLGLSIYSFIGSFIRVFLIICLIYYIESTFNLYGLGVILSIALAELIMAILYIVLLNVIFKYKFNKNSPKPTV